MKITDWNYERKRTRDRLIEYDISIMPLYPHSGGIAVPYPQEAENIRITIPSIIAEARLNVIYPWENYSLTILSHQLYLIARDNGFPGTEKQFLEKFGSLNVITENNVIVGIINNFPMIGDTNALYLDRETGILYYFKATENTINEEIATIMGAIIKGKENEMTFLYIPVRALLIEDTILNCGDASEYIG